MGGLVGVMEPMYSEEVDVAVRAVQMACFLCQKVQQSLISKSNGQVQSKDDNSPVTIAGTFRVSIWGFVILCWFLLLLDRISFICISLVLL